MEDTVDAIRAVERADHFRQEARYCLEVAERKQVVGDRAWLLEMAQHWLEMAVKAEAAEQFSADVVARLGSSASQLRRSRV
jgi:hypothetical protein